jgi:TolB-like protein
MSSIIKGYNYDIFISYRQKDNKHDGWVTEFVDNLKGELESTFKEEISVYFDINPHNGLLETHDVDESLKDKLKCLVFIPIISRTYCDPEAFAWEHEFKAFVEKASKDEYGLKVRLNNGNFASRVLPVIIYDLDKQDIKLCESVLGGVLRGVEFIYKSAGVNRPLLPKEEYAQENLNHINYRDQINKVANAVKEIIIALKQFRLQTEEVSHEVTKPVSTPVKNQKTKIITASAIALILIILSILLIPGLLKPSQESEKSIAVMPFVNLSNDPEQEYFSDGFVEAILNHLFKVGDLKVISSTSTKRYKNTDLSIRDIARELGVSSILEGSVQKMGDNIRITAQLIDARTDVHLWSEIYDRKISDIFAIQSEVAQRVARELKATLTSEEKEQIGINDTENTEAYNLYLQGRFHIQNRTHKDFTKSIEYFEKAVAVDKDYALAYAGLADAYFLLAWYDYMPRPEAYAKSREYAETALGIDKNCAEAYTVLGGILTYYDWNWEEARKELQLAVDLNPNFIAAHSYYSELLDIIKENTEARRQIDIVLKLDPFFPMMRTLSAIYYFHEGRFEKAIDEYLMLMEINPEFNLYLSIFDSYVMLGEDKKAIDAIENYLIRRGDSLSVKYAELLNNESVRSDIKEVIGLLIQMQLVSSNPYDYNLAFYYALTGNREETLNWLEAAFLDRSSSIPRINNDPVYDFLRSDPQFQAIINKMGLSEYHIPK